MRTLSGGMLMCILLALQGCPGELPETNRRDKGSVGAEVFRMFCKRLAAQAGLE